MKVYQCIMQITYTGPVFVIYNPGDKFYEMSDNLSPSYQPERGYPIMAKYIEHDTIHYERLPDDDHEMGYYLYKRYTQYEIDQLLKTNQ